jgi:hypothetical protein
MRERLLGPFHDRHRHGSYPRTAHSSLRLLNTVAARSAGYPNASRDGVGVRPFAATRSVVKPLVIAMLVVVAIAPSTLADLFAAPRVPLVSVVGCPSPTQAPHVWRLARAGEWRETQQPGITSAEKAQLANEPLGQHSYELVGVADFVDAEASRTVGVRGQILASSRVNATGVLAAGRRVGVKGLYIDGASPRINLTSVVDLGPGCADER